MAEVHLPTYLACSSARSLQWSSAQQVTSLISRFLQMVAAPAGFAFLQPSSALANAEHFRLLVIASFSVAASGLDDPRPIALCEVNVACLKFATLE